MSTHSHAIDYRPHRLNTLWHSTIGNKYVAAVTGLILALFVVAHMLGSPKAIEGPGHAAQPREHRPKRIRSTIAARTMPLTGLLILVFVIFWRLLDDHRRPSPRARRGHHHLPGLHAPVRGGRHDLVEPFGATLFPLHRRQDHPPRPPPPKDSPAATPASRTRSSRWTTRASAAAPSRRVRGGVSQGQLDPGDRADEPGLSERRALPPQECAGRDETAVAGRPPGPPALRRTSTAWGPGAGDGAARAEYWTTADRYSSRPPARERPSALSPPHARSGPAGGAPNLRATGQRRPAPARH